MAAMSAKAARGTARSVNEAVARVERLWDGMRSFHDPDDPNATAVVNTSLRMMFDFIDKDRSGSVSRQELALALRRDPNVRKYFGLPASFKRGSREHDEFEAVFARMDGDDSHSITWEEFQRLTHIDPSVTAQLKPKRRGRRKGGIHAFGAVISSDQVR